MKCIHSFFFSLAVATFTGEESAHTEGDAMLQMRVPGRGRYSAATTKKPVSKWPTPNRPTPNRGYGEIDGFPVPNLQKIRTCVLKSRSKGKGARKAHDKAQQVW